MRTPQTAIRHTRRRAQRRARVGHPHPLLPRGASRRNMRKLILAAIFPLCLVAVSAHAQVLNLKQWDAFTSQPALEWSLPDNASGTVVGNWFRYDNKGEKLCSTWQIASLNRGYCVAVATKHASGVTDYPYGLCFGGEDYDNEYFFVISADGSYKVGKFDNGDWADIVEWTESDALNKGMGAVNRLVVDCRDTWRFFINGTQVESIPAGRNFGGNAGIVVENTQAVDFDEFLLAEYHQQGDTEFTQKFGAILADFSNDFANVLGDSINTGLGTLLRQWRAKNPVPDMKSQNFMAIDSGLEYYATLGTYAKYADAVDAYLRLKDHITITPMPCPMLDMGETAKDNVIEGTIWLPVDRMIDATSPYSRLTLAENIYPPGKDRAEWEVGIVLVHQDKK